MLRVVLRRERESASCLYDVCTESRALGMGRSSRSVLGSRFACVFVVGRQALANVFRSKRQVPGYRLKGYWEQCNVNEKCVDNTRDEHERTRTGNIEQARRLGRVQK